MGMRDLAFIIYGLSLIKALDNHGFLLCVVRGLLRNQAVSFIDLSMILMVAEEMNFTDEDRQSKYFFKFCALIDHHCQELLIQQQN